MRVQKACNLTVRLTWEPAADVDHPEHTYGCVEDEAMAVTMAQFAAASAPAARRLIRAETSPTGGRWDPWKPLDLPGVADVGISSAS